MTAIHYDDGRVTLWHGRAAEVARQLEPGSAQTIVTSPPYFGLRDYQADGQIGSEPTPEAFVAALVDTFAALWPVLADDGVLWLNLGDSYSGGSGPGGRKEPARQVAPNRNSRAWHAQIGAGPKNLLGIPWRVALALQAWGWTLRSEVIWQKPNAKPESVTDRPTRDHEHLFMLTKGPSYYYDAAAIREAYEGDRAPSRRANKGRANKETTIDTVYLPGDESDRNKRTVWRVPTQPFPGSHFAVYPPELVRPCIRAALRPGDVVLDPFSGSGTTGMVAQQEGRRYVGIDVNADYLDLSLRTRFVQPVLDFGGEAA